MSAAPGLGVYVNSETVPFYLRSIGIDMQPSHRLSNDHNWLQAVGIDVQPSQHISAYHSPFPTNTDWLDDLNSRYDSSDRVIVFCTELHESTVADLLTLDRPKVEIYICGVIKTEFKYARIYRFMDWFHTSTTFYRENPRVLDRLRPHQVKPLHFDMLLGNARANRDYVHNYVIEHDLKSQVLLTYFKFSHNDLRQSDQFILEDSGLEYITEPRGTWQQVRYYGHRMNLSQVIPISIYNQTAYTLVTETNGVNEFNFYTEKIVKPILARRLFVAIAGRHYLQNLRDMGFQTFDGIIDESYDEVENDWERCAQAMAQVERLCLMPQEEILLAIRPIVTHNCKLMLEQDWYYNPNT